MNVKRKLREIDEMFADPALLEYDIICFKCQKAPINCKCHDKWQRLRHFSFKVAFARLQAEMGYATEEERRLDRKSGRGYI